MEIEKIGIDLVEVERFVKHVNNHRFLNRVFTSTEIEHCLKKRFPEQSFAVRFATKEAVGKALTSGVGFGTRLKWKDVEVITTRRGPFIELYGRVGEFFSKKNFEISMTHTKQNAGAVALLRCEKSVLDKFLSRD